MLTWLLGPSRRQLSSGNNDPRFWTTVAGGDLGKSKSGVNVTEEAALNHAAFFSAVKLLAGTPATLPLYVYKGRRGRRKLVEGHPVEKIFGSRGQPNSNMDAITLRELMGVTIFTRGNGLAELQRAGGRVVQAFPIDPARVKPDLGEGGDMMYRVRRKNGREDVLDRSQVLHIKNIGGDGLWGWATLRRARESLGLGIAAEQAGAQLFGSGLRASGAFKTEKEMKPDAARLFLAELREQYAGLEATGRPMFLYNGLSWDPFTIDPRDAQFLDTRKFQVEEVCRWFGVPPHALMLLDRSTNNNIEHQGIEFLTYCLGYWLAKWEAVYDLSLLSAEERAAGYCIRHDPDELLRTTIQARFEAYKVGREAGMLKVNEMREREDLDLVGDEGDVLLYPTNMGNLKSLLNPPADPPPPQTPPPPAGGPAPADPATSAANNAADPGLAHRDLLIDTLARLLRKEHKAAAAAAGKSGGNFVAWLDEFYPHHAELMEEAIRPVLAAWLSLSRPLAAARLRAEALAHELAGREAALSHSQLLELAGECKPAELASRVDQWIDGNKDRAGELGALGADELLGELS